MRLPWRPVAIDNGPPISTSLTATEAAKLETLALGRRVLEVGSAYGYSATVMGRVASHVLAVDPHDGFGSLADSLPVMRANLEAYGVAGKVSIVIADSQHALSALLAARASFEVVFVDGDHRRDAVQRDMRLGWKLLVPGGHLATHDYREASCTDVAPVCDEFGVDAQVTDTLWVARKP